MPFNGAAFIAGAYTATWNSLALGLCMGSAQQPVVEVQQREQPIDDTDGYARTTLDGILQGTDANWVAALMEWKAATIAALAPFGGLGAVRVGASKYDFAQPLVLTPVSGTLAASGGPLSITASKAILGTNSTLRLSLGPDLRVLPIRMALLPYFVSTSLFNYVVP